MTFPPVPVHPVGACPVCDNRRPCPLCASRPGEEHAAGCPSWKEKALMLEASSSAGLLVPADTIEKAQAVVLAWERLGRCEDEFTEQPEACGDYVEALDSAIIGLRTTLAAAPKAGEAWPRFYCYGEHAGCYCAWRNEDRCPTGGAPKTPASVRVPKADEA